MATKKRICGFCMELKTDFNFLKRGKGKNMCNDCWNKTLKHLESEGFDIKQLKVEVSSSASPSIFDDEFKGCPE